jgi:hypothetical protein
MFVDFVETHVQSLQILSPFGFSIRNRSSESLHNDGSSGEVTGDSVTTTGDETGEEVSTVVGDATGARVSGVPDMQFSSRPNISSPDKLSQSYVPDAVSQSMADCTDDCENTLQYPLAFK